MDVRNGFETKANQIDQNHFLKGLSHEMDLAFEDMHGHWSVLGLNRARSLRWLKTVSGNPGFLASYWSAGFGRFLQVSAISLLSMNNYTPLVIGE